MAFRFKRRRKRRTRFKRKRLTGRRRFRRRRGRQRMTLRRMGRTSTDAIMVKLTLQNTVFPTGSVNPIVTFSLNSAFDPIITGAVDFQPTGYDQWALLYRNYEVLACRINLIAVNNLNTSGYNIAVYPSTQSVKPDYTTASATKYATNRYVSPQNGGHNRAIITKYMSTRKLVGRRTTDDDYTALVDADPAVPLFWHIRAEDTLGVHVAMNTMWQFRLTYYTRFFNRIEITEIPPPP